MGYEIDFLPVGEGEKSGDAIAVRFGNLFGNREEQQVIVIDGGFKDSGEALVNHIRSYYNTNMVDLVIASHSDNDHTSGLEIVLDKMEVSKLWMHLPWKHTEDIADLFKDGRVTDSSVGEGLKRSLDSAYALQELAQVKNIPIEEPFTGTTAGSGHIIALGPTEEYYESLLPDFRATPEPKESAGLLKRAIEEVKGVIETIAENWNIETLSDDGETSAENNSCVVTAIELNNDLLMFTADAGIPALKQVISALDRASFDYSRIKFLQVPHHGSKRNVGPTVLDRLIGPRLSNDSKKLTAFVSGSTGGAPKHPAKKVTNAFRRRGAYTYHTNGKIISHHVDAPGRKNWGPVDPVPFFNLVEV